MPDIAMCGGVGCPQRETCHRHTATPGAFQAWFSEAPGIYYERDGGRGPTWGCHFYMPTTTVTVPEVQK